MTVPGLILDFSPVIIRHMPGSMTDDVMRAHLEGTAKLMAGADREGLRTVTIIDLSQAGRSTAMQRKLQSDWLKQQQAVIKRVSLGAAFVVRTQLVRVGLTAVFWMQPLPHDHIVTTSLDLAIQWAIDKLKRAGIDAPERLVSEGAQAVLSRYAERHQP